MTENELLAELVAELNPVIEPDEVTARMLAEHTGIGWNKAKRILDDKVANGLLTSRMARMPDGKMATAYRRL